VSGKNTGAGFLLSYSIIEEKTDETFTDNGT
jgi:hypothetical protein